MHHLEENCFNALKVGLTSLSCDVRKILATYSTRLSNVLMILVTAQFVPPSPSLVSIN